MFNPGEILYFNSFHFKNGNTPKEKYFVVLKVYNEKLVIASLPTRTDRVPRHIDVVHGCLNDLEGCFNCYHFVSQQVICDNGFGFPLNTFIYGDAVEDYNLESLLDNYVLGVDYTVQGKMTNEEYQNLIECLKASTSLKRKIRRYLS